MTAPKTLPPKLLAALLDSVREDPETFVKQPRGASFEDHSVNPAIVLGRDECMAICRQHGVTFTEPSA